MSGDILVVQGLQKSFGGLRVTQDVSLNLAQGNKEAIIGPNGAGKSTFFNLLTGYHRPDSGTVTFEGKNITGRPPHKVVRAGIARAFQVSNIFVNMTARENVLAGELSQGDKKKLELALALGGKPKLLLLDEPTAGMSLEETRATMELVDRLNAEFGLTILFTEHDMSVVFNNAQRVTLLHRGEIIVQGTPDEVRKDSTEQKIYLGEHEL